MTSGKTDRQQVNGGRIKKRNRFWNHPVTTPMAVFGTSMAQASWADSAGSGGPVGLTCPGWRPAVGRNAAEGSRMMATGNSLLDFARPILQYGVSDSRPSTPYVYIICIYIYRSLPAVVERLLMNACSPATRQGRMLFPINPCNLSLLCFIIGATANLRQGR